MEGAMEGAPDTGVMGRRDRVVEALRIMQTWLAGWDWLAWVGGGCRYYSICRCWGERLSALVVG